MGEFAYRPLTHSNPLIVLPDAEQIAFVNRLSPHEQLFIVVAARIGPSNQVVKWVQVARFIGMPERDAIEFSVILARQGYASVGYGNTGTLFPDGRIIAQYLEEQMPAIEPKARAVSAPWWFFDKPDFPLDAPGSKFAEDLSWPKARMLCGIQVLGKATGGAVNLEEVWNALRIGKDIGWACCVLFEMEELVKLHPEYMAIITMKGDATVRELEDNRNLLHQQGYYTGGYPDGVPNSPPENRQSPALPGGLTSIEEVLLSTVYKLSPEDQPVDGTEVMRLTGLSKQEVIDALHGLKGIPHPYLAFTREPFTITLTDRGRRCAPVTASAEVREANGERQSNFMVRFAKLTWNYLAPRVDKLLWEGAFKKIVEYCVPAIILFLFFLWGRPDWLRFFKFDWNGSSSAQSPVTVPATTATMPTTTSSSRPTP